jgi:hypothetical protein
MEDSSYKRFNTQCSNLEPKKNEVREPCKILRNK